MSYNPSEAISTRAIQIDVNGSSALSADITLHTNANIIAKSIYFIDVREYITIGSAYAGAIYYINFIGFATFGGQFKANRISSGSTACDESYCGVTSRDIALTAYVQELGSTGIAPRTTFRSFWRVL